MSQTFQQIKHLIDDGNIKISAHGYDELSNDDIFITVILESIAQAIVIEDYPNYPKGPSVLLLQYDHSGKPIHTVWGIPKNALSPAVLITAYRPDSKRWSSDFLRRKI